MGATVVLVCASHSTSHFTLQSQLRELPRRSLTVRVMEGTQRRRSLSSQPTPQNQALLASQAVMTFPMLALTPLPPGTRPSVALSKELGLRPYKSLRMSRGRKMSLGSVCRLLLASELQERPVGHLKMVTEAKDHKRELGVYVCVGGCCGPMNDCMCGMYSQVC